MESEQDLLASLYGGVGKAEGWSQFVDALARFYPGGRAIIAMHDVTRQNSLARAGGQWDPDHFKAYNQHFVTVNPWIPNLPRRQVGKASPAEFLLPRAELVKTEFYNDFLRRAQLDSGIGVTVERNSSRHIIVSVVFPQVTAENDPDALGRLQRLVPHLQRVAQLNRQLEVMERRAIAADAALDRLATAMLIVGSRRRFSISTRRPSVSSPLEMA